MEKNVILLQRTPGMTSSFDIKQSLSGIYHFSNEELHLFTSKLNYRKLKKKGILLQEGQICSDISFIQSGSLRVFRNSGEAELTMNFFTEGDWVADPESLLTQQPSQHVIIATEDSEIASISLTDIHRLMDTHPCFRMLNALIAGFSISSAHLSSLYSKSPDERYQELLKKHPQWINRFPQMQIASYLGMTPETLSRVRARIGSFS